jgi:thioredoxin 1
MNKVVEVDDSSFEAEVMQAEGLVLVDFSAAWCAPCKKLEPIVHDLAGDYDGRIKVVRVDVDQAQSVAARFGVMSVPTLLLMHNGAVKDQIIGLASKQALADRIDKVI